MPLLGQRGCPTGVPVSSLIAFDARATRPDHDLTRSAIENAPDEVAQQGLPGI